MCLKPWQFSCWNKNDLNYAYLTSAARSRSRPRSSPRSSVLLIRWYRIQSAAIHYYATTMPKTPAWAAKASRCCAWDITYSSRMCRDDVHTEIGWLVVLCAVLLTILVAGCA